MAAAVAVTHGTLTITNSTLSGNSPYHIFTRGFGGGVANDGTLTITDSTLSGNTAGYGGGVHEHVAVLNLKNSTLSGNVANAF